jgi:subtilisin family serine protease
MVFSNPQEERAFNLKRLEPKFICLVISILFFTACGGSGATGGASEEKTNTAPTLSGNNSLPVTEGQTVVASLRATDRENDTLTYSIVSGDDQTMFDLTAGGELSFFAAPDFEVPGDEGQDNVYNLTVQVSDGILSTSQDITVTVIDAFEGRVVDAPISGASVFIDINGNGLREVNEPSGVTDDEGFFGVAMFDLVADSGAKVISVGGTDILTGQTLPRLVMISDVPADLRKPANVTPVTTVLAAAEITSDKTELLIALGLSGTPEELLTRDGWQEAVAGDADAKAIQQVNQQLGLLLQVAATLAGGAAGTADAPVLMVKSLAKQIISFAILPSGLDLTSAAEIQALFSNAMAAATLGLSIQDQALEAIAESVASVNSVIADPFLDPMSNTASEIVGASQKTLLASVLDLVAGNRSVEDFNQQTTSARLFQSITLAADAPDTDGDGVADALDSDDDGDGVKDSADAFSKDALESADTDGDGIGNNADADDDNDGLLDAQDGFPLVPLGALVDTDADGRPNDCDAACQESGMSADADDDNDGIADADDGYPLVALGSLTDTDGDGRPNDCDAACQEAGMSADSDDDNDGVADADDGYPLAGLGSLTDTDGDGRPDDCDAACQETGMSADADDDNDGVDDAADPYPLDANVSVLPTTAPQALALELLPQSENLLTGTLTSTAQDNRAVTYSITTQASHGTATVTNSLTGEFSYTTSADRAEADSFSYIVNDGFVDSMPSTISVSLNTDPLYKYQWHLSNTGQTNFANTGGSVGADMNVSGAIAAGYTGQGVVVAVVDTGLEIAHEDLIENVVAGSYDFVDNDTDPTLAGNGGDHGTAVAGITAARGWNNIGPRGAAPKVSLKGYNWLENQSAAAWISTFGGEEYSRNVDIFNNSWGFAPLAIDQAPSATEEVTLSTTLPAMRGGKGAIFVKSAGNDFDEDSNGLCGTSNGDGGLSCRDANQDSTHNNAGIIVVSALNADGSRFSRSTIGSAIWVSAPGGEYGSSGAGGAPAIMTTDVQGCTKGYVGGGGDGANEFDSKSNPYGENANCNYMSTMNGTSSAAPNTSGVIALMLEANSSLTMRDVKHILATTSEQVDASIAPVIVDGITYHEWVVNEVGYTYHNYYGFGGIDATAAVNSAKSYTGGSLGAQSTLDWISTGTIDLDIGFGSTVTRAINVPTAGTVEYVLVRLNLTHADPSEVGFRLTSPSGTTTTIWQPHVAVDTAVNGRDAYLSASAFYGESMAGEWILSAYDHVNGNTMTLHSYEIQIKHR